MVSVGGGKGTVGKRTIGFNMVGWLVGNWGWSTHLGLGCSFEQYTGTVQLVMYQGSVVTMPW